MFEAVQINVLDSCEISDLHCAVKPKQVCVARVISAHNPSTRCMCVVCARVCVRFKSEGEL